MNYDDLYLLARIKRLETQNAYLLDALVVIGAGGPQQVYDGTANPNTVLFKPDDQTKPAIYNQKPSGTQWWWHTVDKNWY